MARRSRRIHLHKQRIGVAVRHNGLYLLHVSAGRTFVPKLLTTTRPKPCRPRLQRQPQRLCVHPCHHEHFARIVLLHDRRDEPTVVVLQFADIHASSPSLSSLLQWPPICSQLTSKWQKIQVANPMERTNRVLLPRTAAFILFKAAFVQNQRLFLVRACYRTLRRCSLLGFFATFSPFCCKSVL